MGVPCQYFSEHTGPLSLATSPWVPVGVLSTGDGFSVITGEEMASSA